MLRRGVACYVRLICNSLLVGEERGVYFRNSIEINIELITRQLKIGDTVRYRNFSRIHF